MCAGRKIPIILNPIAGGGRLMRSRQQLDRTASACGAELEWWLTNAPGHAIELARQAVAEHHPLVLAFGGDGTYNEVARGLLGTSTSLGVLPGGTTSVLAYEFEIPRPAHVALASLLTGRDRPMRVGRTSKGDIFLMMLSSGPDALVLERLMPGLKRLGGKVGVAAQAVIELLRWRRLPRLRVQAEGRTVDCGWVIVGKTRCYAGPYHATPGADPFSARFEVVALTGRGRRAAVPFALGLPFGRHVNRPDVRRFDVDSVSLLPPDGASGLSYQVDGDLIGPLPVEIGIHREELLVRLPHQVPSDVDVGEEARGDMALGR